MDIPVFLYPSAAGLSFAAAAVAAGAPLFSDGLRTLRLNRCFATLRETALADMPAGFVQVSGQVALESPLFSPLSGVACAGYRLEVHGIGTPVARSLDVFRPFRVTAGGVSARVHTAHARWQLSETATRDVAPGQPLSQNLKALLARLPEVSWLRRSGFTLRIVERTLADGAQCHVVGYARQARPLEVAYETEFARTGTDDAAAVAVAIPAEMAAANEPELRLDSGEHLSFLLVSDRAPGRAELAVARVRALGLVAGPILTLFGMLYFAHSADYLRSLGHR